MNDRMSPSGRRPAKQESGRLLIVDDNKVNRLLLGRGLEQQGHTVDFAADGVQALDKLTREDFDLVLLDIEMPEMDGYQVLERIIADTELRHSPVIMTTAMEELDSVVRCIELGAEDYLTKPVNAVLLRARINASLEKKRLRDQQRELIKTFATEEVAEQMLVEGFELGGRLVEATAMFAASPPSARPSRRPIPLNCSTPITPWCLRPSAVRAASSIRCRATGCWPCLARPSRNPTIPNAR